MSNITYTTIQTGFPVPGVDNDSQGFRDNFTAIAEALQVAKEEIGLLETRTVLKTSLDADMLPVDNDLDGSTIYNGFYNTLFGISYVTTISQDSALVVDLNNGDCQTFIINEGTTSGPVSILFQHWPEAGYYGKVRVQLKTLQDVSRVITPIGTTAGTVRKSSTFPTTLTVHATTLKYQILEAWTNDGGATVFLNYLGEY